MAKRVIKAKAEPKSTPIEAKKLDLSKYFDLLKKLNSTQLLVILLIIAAFLIGVLFTKVSYLEKNQATPSGAAAPAGQGQQAQELQPGQKVDVDKGHLPGLGSKDAKVTIVEFSDFQCPFCKRWVDETKDLLMKEYIDTGKVLFTYRQFPIVQLHPNAPEASEASECANEQNKFWQYHDLLFKEQDVWSPLPDPTSQFSTYASQLGLNQSQFDSCLSAGKFKDAVTKDIDEGSAAGVNGTPTFFVNGTAIVGAQPYSAFKAAIDAELAK